MRSAAIRSMPPKAQGAVAVEMAIVLPIMVSLITALVWFAQIFWYYSVLQKASYDAARFLATATPAEISTPGPGSSPALVATLAQAIVEEQTGIIDKAKETMYVNVHCDFRICGISVPSTVRVSIEVRMPFPVLEQQSLTLTTDVTMRYVGG